MGVSQTDAITALNSLPPWVVLLGLVGVLCSVGTIFVVLNAFRSWRTSGQWICAKLHNLALALACLGLVWFLLAWKLMNFNLNY